MFCVRYARLYTLKQITARYRMNVTSSSEVFERRSRELRDILAIQDLDTKVAACLCGIQCPGGIESNRTAHLLSAACLCNRVSLILVICRFFCQCGVCREILYLAPPHPKPWAGEGEL